MRTPAYNLEAVNRRLKEARTGFQVWQRGDRLSLRGVLPPKPGSSKDKPHQQVLALGVYANPSGLEIAEAKAHEISTLLAQRRFSWQAEGVEDLINGKCNSWISKFKKDWLSKQEKPPEELEVVWNDRFWLPAYKWLNPSEDLTETAALRVVQRFKPNTRSRQLACQKLAQLLEFAEIKTELREYQGSYGNQQTKPRDLPTDEAIAEWYDHFKDPSWQRVYGLLAVYGLRPHEAFFCVQEEPLSLKVLDGKTGGRLTWAFPPAWVDEWKLNEPVELPSIKGRTHREYGQRVGQYFRRMKMPWGAYDLRHAWCVRNSVVFGLPIAVAARMAGHSEIVHTRTYSRWIRDDQTEQVYRKLVLGEGDRP